MTSQRRRYNVILALNAYWGPLCKNEKPRKGHSLKARYSPKIQNEAERKKSNNKTQQHIFDNRQTRTVTGELCIHVRNIKRRAPSFKQQLC